jgi:hypothetical protein
MTWNELLPFGAGGIVAWAALLGAGSAIGGDAHGGGSGGVEPSSECIYDVKPDSGSSECKRNGRCGPVDCCYAEFTFPPHDDLIPGTKRIVSTEKIAGKFTQRRCDTPVYFLGLLFGGYDCDIEREEPMGEVYRYVLAVCPPEESKQGPPSGAARGTE